MERIGWGGGVDVEDVEVLVLLMIMMITMMMMRPMAKVRDTLGIVLNGKTYRPLFRPLAGDWLC